ncbi:MAG TPA: hypothetical protein VLW06_02560 [Terriglobales bacterium]|nr:hypothetical protein [Terriglobales bacterium]
MYRIANLIGFLLLLISAGALAQEASENQPPTPITVRGCLRTERGNYIVIEDRTGAVYAMQGVGNKLNGFRRKEVEVTGIVKPGSVRTGVRPEKAGDNPSDTTHGIDGVPLEVHDIRKDIRIVARHCKAADQQ